MTAGRKPNRIKTISFQVPASPLVIDYLEELVDTELYGKTAPEVALTLIREGIRRLQAEKQLDPKRKKKTKRSR